MGKVISEIMKKLSNTPFKVGEYVFTYDSHISPKPLFIKDKKVYGTITEVNDKSIKMETNDGIVEVLKANVERNPDFIGVNPLPEHSWHDDMKECGFTTGWVYNSMGTSMTKKDGTPIYYLNFNPYIKDKDGNKVYYQRDLCWTLEDKQNLIESMYNELGCGAVVIRYNDDDRMNEVNAEYDVVDGKQRLSTLIEFFNDEFADKNGYYWSDFSRVAQRRFLSSRCFAFYLIEEKSPDSAVKKAFLNVNFTGVPMSKEHIEFVKSINI